MSERELRLADELEEEAHHHVGRACNPKSAFISVQLMLMQAATVIRTQSAFADFKMHAALADRPADVWSCKARLNTAPEPVDCDWPHCGCDPHAERVMSALIEEGWAPVARPEPAQPTELDGGYHRGLANGFDEAKRQMAQEPAQPAAHTLLRNLAAEVGGILGICEPELRQIASNTNVACLKRRLREADAYLNATPPSHPAPSEAGAERQWTTVAMVDDQPITTMPVRCLKWPCSGEGSMATLRPVRAPHGKWYMQCPLCDGSYGECEEPAKGDASS